MRLDDHEKARLLQSVVTQHVAEGWTLHSHLGAIAVVGKRPGLTEQRRVITIGDDGSTLYRAPDQAEFMTAEAFEMSQRRVTFTGPGTLPIFARWQRPIGLFFIGCLGLMLVVAATVPKSPPSPAGFYSRDTDAPAPAATLESRALETYQPRIADVMQRMERCDVARTFYSGWDRRQDAAVWSVACKDGREFMMTAYARTGDVRTLNCALLTAVATVSCFTRLDGR